MENITKAAKISLNLASYAMMLALAELLIIIVLLKYTNNGYHELTTVAYYLYMPLSIIWALIMIRTSIVGSKATIKNLYKR